MTIRRMRLSLAAALLLCLPSVAFAQRELHWDTLSVTAHLNEDGSLQVTEKQTMVFTGDWNGGKRTFNIRPRQTLSFEGMSHWNSTPPYWQPMTESASLANVDDYAFTDATTVRWRSRLPSDPPFDRNLMSYLLRYTLSGILKQDKISGDLLEPDHFTLDHDFAFRDREGVIKNFELKLTFDPVWQPIEPVRDLYTTTNLAPGRSFVLTIRLKHVGAGTVSFFDESRPPAIQMAVLALFGLTVVSMLWTLVSEKSKGRFVPVKTTDIDDAWLREHILRFPAELVSAAWDDSIGHAEVVALLARMTTEGKLESQISDGAKQAGMTLRLKVDRKTLSGYERALVDKLFFDDRTTTSTTEVKAHYTKTGFDPTGVIRPELTKALQDTFPFANASRLYGIATFVLFLAGVALLITAWMAGDLQGLLVFLLPIGTLIVAGLACIGGMQFRQHMEWGWRAALLSLLAPCVVIASVAAFLWYYVGTDALTLSTETLVAIVVLALGAGIMAVNSLRSRQKREGVAFRKQLAAGRLFFMSELSKPKPALRDDWYPWVLAFGLGKQMDDWSVRNAGGTGHGHITSYSSTSSGSSSSTASSSSSSSSWTGFGGGRSGGAGAGASWAAAAGGLAAGVAAPSSSSSGGGGGGSSGGGSSGGGGGGGW